MADTFPNRCPSKFNQTYPERRRARARNNAGSKKKGETPEESRAKDENQAPTTNTETKDTNTKRKTE